MKQALRYLFYLLLCIQRDVGHSREEQSDHLQPKGDEEKAKSRHIGDLSLRVRQGAQVLTQTSCIQPSDSAT